MIAALPMYDRVETREETDRFWSLISQGTGFSSLSLSRDQDLWDIWRHPELILAQTCGMPFRVSLRESVNYVITPDYALDGCPAGYYNSVFLARRSETRDLSQIVKGTYAYNEALSQSGWAGPITHLLQSGLKPTKLVQSHAHVASALMVAEGEADYCAIDAHTWRLIQRYDAFAAVLCELERTQPTPALPYICSKQTDSSEIESRVLDAFQQLSPKDSAALGLSGFIKIDPRRYFDVPTPPTPDEMTKISDMC